MRDISVNDPSLPIRHHHLRAMLRSPAHYIATRLGQADDEPTASMERGSGLHELLAGHRDVLAWEEGRPRRGKEYDAFVDANPDALILTAADLRMAQAMRDAIMADPLAAPLCTGGESECTIVWDLDMGDGPARTTPDRIKGIPSGGLVKIVEVKTAKSADPPRFAFTARRDYGYHTQAAWHRRGVLATLGEDAPIDVEVWLVVVESATPHVVSTIRVADALMDAADREIDDAIAQIRACRLSGTWPGYTPEPWTWDADELDLVVDE
jgi:hypothetical protein